MFSSGNTDKLTKPGRKMAGLDALRTATNEQGVPLPWFCGKARVGVTYVSRMFDVVRTPVHSGGKGGELSGYKYSAGFAALVGFGAVDAIYNVILNDDILWPGVGGTPLYRPGAGVDYVDLTVESMGTLRIYWGTETQVADPGLVYPTPDATVITHPAYRGFCYVRSLKWLLGQFSGGDVPAPNLEVIAARYPEPPWWVLGSVKIGEDINAAAGIWDLLTLPRANPIDSELIDIDSLKAVAAQLDLEDFGLSPVITTTKYLREALLEICQSFDGFFRQSRTGKITFGLHRPVSVVVPEFIPDDMTETPKISVGSWTQTSSGAQVRFKNGALYLNDDVASAFNPANFSLTGRPDAPSIDRPFITDPNLAQKVSNAMAQRNGIPAGGGVIRLRKSKISTLQAGDRFQFHFPQISCTNLRAIATAIEWPAPGQPEIVVDYEADNTQTMAGLYVPPEYLVPPSNVVTPVLTPLQFGFQIFGDGMPDNAHAWFGFAAVAPTLLHNGFFIWRESPDASSDYVDIGPQYAAWSPELYLYGSTVAIGATTFEIYLGPEAMLGGMLGIGDPNFDAFPSADIAAGKVFLALDCGGFGDPVEIVKVTALVPGGGTGRYQVTAVRGQWGTIDAAHDAWSTSGVQSVCAMFSSDTLARVGLPAPFAEEKFLLQPALAGRRADITTLTPISINVAVNDTPPPQNLRAFDDRLNPAYTTGQNIPFAWDLTAFDPEFTLVTELTCAELEIYDAAGTTLMTTIFPGLGVQTYLWTNVDLVTVLGSETDFHVRAYQSVNGVRSATYATLFVRKI